MRPFLPRNDKRWGRYKNRGDCPENGIPLWQVLNPFALGLNGIDRFWFEENMADTEVLRDNIHTTPNGMLYVSFGLTKPEPSQIRELRMRVYDILPFEIKDNLPDEIKRKYGVSN